MSGTIHVKYDHYHYPKNIDLRCPYCGNHSIAINENVPEAIVHFIDISPFEKVWTFTCTHCIKKYPVQWSEIQKMDLWYKIQMKNETVWSWNKQHLDLIIRCFKKEDVETHAWSFFKTYIRKNWLKKIKTKSDIQKLENLLMDKNSLIYQKKI